MPNKPTIPPSINRVMKQILRSPLHGLVSKSILLITISGRRSGRSYTTPVSYSQIGGEVTIFTHSNWWQNLQDGKPVTLRIRGRDYAALAYANARDKQAIASSLAAHLARMPSDAQFYNVSFSERKQPRTEEVERAAQSVVMITCQLLEYASKENSFDGSVNL